MFRNRLTKVYRHIGKQARKADISCYRLYDHDLPEFPFRIEFYGDKLYVAEYKRRHGMNEEEHDEWMQASIAVMVEVLNIPEENIFLRLRQRKPGRLGQYQKLNEAAQEFIVEENGLKFLINLKDYLDTGLFLDHRNTRQLIREKSENKKVLNLFAYTGSFSVYAAAGRASEVTTIDLSNTYLEWAKRNMLLNDFAGEDRFRFFQADIMKWIENAPENYYDLIIMDPPTFSNSKRMEGMLDIQRDHAPLINHCMKTLQPGGELCFSNNYQKFVLDKDAITAASIKDITRQTTPFDFEGRLNRVCFWITK
ncbi:MAG: class I SAM-dependent methyltransferase [Chitinophagaceae bacterium]